MNNPIRQLLLFVCVMLAQPAYALTLHEVLESSHRHAPQIGKAEAALEEKDARVQEAQGAFDWELNSSVSQRMGVYDGNYIDTQVTRRFSDSNARIYGGYRVSSGELPIYEDYYNTSTGGELNIGIAFALLRDRIIDEERFQFRDAVLAEKQQQAETYLTLLRTQHDAMRSYAQWLADAHVVRVMQELVALAKERHNALKTQVREGDVARIYLTENEQNIARREAQLADARRNLARAAQRLSIFYRDRKGQSLVPSVADIPDLATHKSELHLDDLKLAAQIERAQKLRPEQISIDFVMQREQNRRLLGENAMLPKLDLAIEGVQNIGSRAAVGAGNEGLVMLKLSIPLQQNVGEGRVRAADARLKALEAERKLLNDQIAADIRAIAAVAQETAEEIKQTKREVEAADGMRKAESQRFAEGDVDFFVLNMREERLADAKLRHINAQRLWLENLAMFYFMTLDEQNLVP